MSELDRLNDLSKSIELPKLDNLPNPDVTIKHIFSRYLMRGGNIGELAVHVEFNYEPLPSPIWVKEGDDRDGWTNYNVNMR